MSPVRWSLPSTAVIITSECSSFSAFSTVKMVCSPLAGAPHVPSLRRYRSVSPAFGAGTNPILPEDACVAPTNTKSLRSLFTQALAFASQTNRESSTKFWIRTSFNSDREPTEAPPSAEVPPAISFEPKYKRPLFSSSSYIKQRVSLSFCCKFAQAFGVPRKNFTYLANIFLPFLILSYI